MPLLSLRNVISALITQHSTSRGGNESHDIFLDISLSYVLIIVVTLSVYRDIT